MSGNYCDNAEASDAPFYALFTLLGKKADPLVTTLKVNGTSLQIEGLHVPL